MDYLYPSHRNPFTENVEHFSGRLIAIEGMDGTGKNTQARLLLDALQSEGYQVGFYQFPDYESPTGQAIKEYLNSTSTDLSPIQRGQLFCNNRLAKRDQIVQDLREGRIVVCDRYIMSNAYNIVSEPPLYQLKTRKALERIEIIQNAMPIPHLTFILDLPSEISTSMVLKKAPRAYTPLKQDRHESDALLQEKVREFYLSLQNEKPLFYQVINCRRTSKPEDDQPRSKESIHREIWSKFKAYETISQTL